ncbi:hypothetical protein P775_18595 [Puniceibacterium antarcticum]|uniref:Uncharacterized protein n=1 Tax=Puniceibacterium antarcticum TaxID=1206336 RepID=A0A2G8RAM2_9RHOB|nr:hypothetical protein P775_18595 [Puniceibacterium antarcticum]
MLKVKPVAMDNTCPLLFDNFNFSLRFSGCPQPITCVGKKLANLPSLAQILIFNLRPQCDDLLCDALECLRDLRACRF